MPINTSTLADQPNTTQVNQLFTSPIPQVTAAVSCQSRHSTLTADLPETSHCQDTVEQASSTAQTIQPSQFSLSTSAAPPTRVTFSTVSAAASENSDTFSTNTAQQSLKSAAALWDTEPREQVSQKAATQYS